MPLRGLEKVYDETNEDGFYADYSKYEKGELLDLVREGFIKSGFQETCNEFDGHVRGFKKGELEYVVKVDALGDRQGLSIFNGKGKERLIFGVCFRGYTLKGD